MRKIEEEAEISEDGFRLNGAFSDAPKEPASKSQKHALLQLLKSYSAFINDASDINLDMDAVLNRLIETTRNLKPPPK